MKALAYKTVSVCLQNGANDPKSRIDPGDLCEIGGKTLAGLYPVLYPTSRGPKTRWVRNLKGFLVNQNDYASIPYPAPGYEKATIKSSGCGVCSAVMAVGAMTGRKESVLRIANCAVLWNARVSGGTLMSRLLTHLLPEHDLFFAGTSSVAELVKHLKSGGVAICNTAGRGMFSTGGHYIVALGMLDGKVCIADPGLYYGKYSSAKRRAKVTVSGDLIFADAATLDADCVGRSPRYYLISKR